MIYSLDEIRQYLKMRGIKYKLDTDYFNYFYFYIKVKDTDEDIIIGGNDRIIIYNNTLDDGIEMNLPNYEASLEEIFEQLVEDLNLDNSIVKSVEEVNLEDSIPVYDIEVPGSNNFLLNNGLVVHNSVDTIQQFKLQGFNSSTLSVDRSKDAYISLRNAINEGRLLAPKIDLLEKEYADVEDDASRNKVDHTINGSKDILDSVAANVYKSNNYEAPPVSSNSDNINNFIDVNEQEDEYDDWIVPKGYTVVDLDNK